MEEVSLFYVDGAPIVAYGYSVCPLPCVVVPRDWPVVMQAPILFTSHRTLPPAIEQIPPTPLFKGGEGGFYPADVLNK